MAAPLLLAWRRPYQQSLPARQQQNSGRHVIALSSGADRQQFAGRGLHFCGGRVIDRKRLEHTRLLQDRMRGPDRRMQELSQIIVQRLYDARYILAVAAALALALTLSGLVAEWQVLLGLAVLFAAACLPARTGSQRERDRLREIERRAPVETIVFATCESLDDPAFVLAPGSIVKFQNRAAAERFGAVNRGAHLSSLLRSPAILELVNTATVSGSAHSIDYIEKVPSERWYRVRIAPMTGIAGLRGDSELFLLTFRDQSKARRMDRMRSDFIANASHELRTPLASLTGFIETMRGPARDDPEARERFLGIMHEQAGRMTRLVDDLLSLSRLELKAHVTPTDRVDLIPLLRHVADTLKPLANDLGVVIRIDLPDTPVVVQGDNDELIQVFENLIENACKYGKSGGKVEVFLRMEGVGSQPEVVVRDDGPGIPREHVPRLTERFYRVSVEASRSRKGTGLGLAIVKHILTRHRARLIVYSTVGKGSEFCVRFAGTVG
jgi:two-component system phosphate regulon sensor histidine kinase PhoR